MTAASIEFTPVAGASSTRPPAGVAAAQIQMAGAGSFWSLLDNCMAQPGVSSGPRGPKPSLRETRDRFDLPVPVAPTVRPETTSALGLSLRCVIPQPAGQAGEEPAQPDAPTECAAQAPAGLTPVGERTECQPATPTPAGTTPPVPAPPPVQRILATPAAIPLPQCPGPYSPPPPVEAPAPNSDRENPIAPSSSEPLEEPSAAGEDDPPRRAETAEVAFAVRWLQPERPESEPAAAQPEPAVSHATAVHPASENNRPQEASFHDSSQPQHGDESGGDSLPERTPSAKVSFEQAAPDIRRAAEPAVDAPKTPALANTANAVSGSLPPNATVGTDPPLPPSSPSLRPLPTPAAAPSPEVAEIRETVPQPLSHGVSLHLGDAESGVDIRLAERAGEVRVTVETPDRGLAESLRSDLPALVGKLKQNGFEAETWRPQELRTELAQRGPTAPPALFHEGSRREGRQRPPQPRPPRNPSRWAGEWQSRIAPITESQT